ncbi:hypothetical protein ACTNED_10080 [Absicoccus porci]|uniref:hypothetical protein n=1 Tax=Absicoccus porci TaxID=2486576 RepID=UPI003F8BD7A9
MKLHFSRNEIKFILKMYPIAKSKVKQLNYHLYRDKNNDNLLRFVNFYNLIIETVEIWLNGLSLDENEIIKMRYFKNYSLDMIAIYLGYANHSTILYKDNKILSKLERGT